MIWEVIKEAGVLLGSALFRNLWGWAQKSFEDGAISEYEWRQLVVTSFRVLGVTMAAYWSLSFAGIDIPLVAAAFGGVAFDFMMHTIGKALKKK